MKLILVFLFFPVHGFGQTLLELWPDAKVQQSAEIEYVNSLHSSDFFTFTNIEFQNPGLIAVVENAILLYNFYQKQLYTFNWKQPSSNIKKIGAGNGSGPGEYRFISSISMDKQQNKYALDTELLRISVWDINNELTDVLNLGIEGGIPAKITADGGQILVKYAFAGNSNYQFGLMSENGTLMSQFHELHPWGAVKSPLLYEGVITSFNGKVVYASANFGVFMMYDIEGNHFFTRQMVTPKNGLELLVQQQSEFSVASSRGRESVFTALDVCMTEDNILILYSGTKNLRANRIDVYNTINGDYEGSYLLDEYVIKIAVQEGTLFGIVAEDIDQDSKIVMYDISSLSVQ